MTVVYVYLLLFVGCTVITVHVIKGPTKNEK